MRGYYRKWEMRKIKPKPLTQNDEGPRSLRPRTVVRLAHSNVGLGAFGLPRRYRKLQRGLNRQAESSLVT